MAGFLQIPAHGIAMNLRLKSIYNPGLGAAMLLYPRAEKVLSMRAKAWYDGKKAFRRFYHGS
jgi:hypothetical protein